MKKLLVTILLIFSAVSFADITISKPVLNGNAIQLPNGMLQVTEPTMTIDGQIFYLNYNNNINDKTGEVACSLIGKKFVTVVTFVSTDSLNVVGFMSYGMSKHIYNGTNYQWHIVQTLTCK